VKQALKTIRGLLSGLWFVILTMVVVIPREDRLLARGWFNVKRAVLGAITFGSATMMVDTDTPGKVRIVGVHEYGPHAELLRASRRDWIRCPWRVRVCGGGASMALQYRESARILYGITVALIMAMLGQVYGGPAYWLGFDASMLLLSFTVKRFIGYQRQTLGNPVMAKDAPTYYAYTMTFVVPRETDGAEPS
jgi:hypothetical protein